MSENNSKQQTEAQYILLYGQPERQSRTAKACFLHLFRGVDRLSAAFEYGITGQTVSTFIQKNDLKHMERQRYIDSGEE